MSTWANKAAVFAASVCVTVTFLAGPASADTLPRDKWPKLPLREENFSATWWRQASTEERYGFLYGIWECMTYNIKQNTKLFDDDDEILRINSIMIQKKWEKIPIGQIVESDIYQKGPPEEPDVYSEPGGYEVWVNAEPQRKRGIVEGYVTCSERHSEKLWFNEVDFYVKIFDILYDIDEIYGRDQYSGTIGGILDNYGYKPFSDSLIPPKDSYKTLPP